MHGTWQGTVKATDKGIIIDGKEIEVEDGRMDEAEHPFTVAIHPHDVRITADSVIVPRKVGGGPEVGACSQLPVSPH